MGNTAYICKPTKNPSNKGRLSLNFTSPPPKLGFLSTMKSKFTRKAKETSETYPEYPSPNETIINLLENSPTMKKMQKDASLDTFKVFINPLSHYQIGVIIGNGPHGTVSEALSMDNGEQVAIKKLVCKPESLDNIRYYLQKKLLDIDHFNLVNYISIEEWQNCEVNIVSELISGSSLEAVLSLFGKLAENVCRLFIEQMLHGLEHLHTKGSYHGNLKPRNIFIDKNGKVKLGDPFIISRKMLVMENSNLAMGLKPFCYLSPEYLIHQVKTIKSDIWALGCILLEMLTKERPWGKNHVNLGFIKQSLLSNRTPEIPPKPLTENCKSFLNLCLSIDPLKRGAIQELLQHPFILGENGQNNKKLMKMRTSSTGDKGMTKKELAKSKSNQQMLFVKLKTGLVNNGKDTVGGRSGRDFIQEEEKADKEEYNSGEFKIKISGGGTNLNAENGNGQLAVKNNNKFLNRMTTAEIRKNNEYERKKFEEELLKSLE